MSKDNVTGLVKMLLKELCRQFAILVNLTTPELINVGVVLIVTMSRSTDSVATSSMLLN